MISLTTYTVHGTQLLTKFDTNVPQNFLTKGTSLQNASS